MSLSSILTKYAGFLLISIMSSMRPEQNRVEQKRKTKEKEKEEEKRIFSGCVFLFFVFFSFFLIEVSLFLCTLSFSVRPFLCFFFGRKRSRKDSDAKGCMVGELKKKTNSRRKEKTDRTNRRGKENGKKKR